MTFTADDLVTLDETLLARASAVVPLRDIHAGEADATVIGLRHDVDNILEPCLELAAWEAERGYRATYFVLHDTGYWNDQETLRPALEEIAGLGHEIGIHCNAIAAALETGWTPAEILADAIERLRSWGHQITGVVAHGDRICHQAGFVNDEMFVECARPEMGAPDRTLSYRDVALRLRPTPLADFGLEYDGYRCGRRGLYLSDSGGRWSEPIEAMGSRFPSDSGQLHMLWHPCWWTRAFAHARVAA